MKGMNRYQVLTFSGDLYFDESYGWKLKSRSVLSVNNCERQRRFLISKSGLLCQYNGFYYEYIPKYSNNSEVSKPLKLKLVFFSCSDKCFVSFDEFGDVYMFRHKNIDRYMLKSLVLTRVEYFRDLNERAIDCVAATNRGFVVTIKGNVYEVKCTNMDEEDPVQVFVKKLSFEDEIERVKIISCKTIDSGILFVDSTSKQYRITDLNELRMVKKEELERFSAKNCPHLVTRLVI